VGPSGYFVGGIDTLIQSVSFHTPFSLEYCRSSWPLAPRRTGGSHALAPGVENPDPSALTAHSGVQAYFEHQLCGICHAGYGV
jgi:hypothetical protein